MEKKHGNMDKTWENQEQNTINWRFTAKKRRILVDFGEMVMF